MERIHLQRFPSLKFQTRFCAVTVIIIGFLVLQICLTLEKSVFSIESNSNQPRTRQNKNILIWNSAERIETATFGLGNQPFIHHECEIPFCTLFDNASSLSLEKYDAIIFHVHTLWAMPMPTFRRLKHQRFIFLTQESPTSMSTSNFDVTTLGSMFNWTMSYKLNSDILFLYGRIRPRSSAPKTEEEANKMIKETNTRTGWKFASNKTRQVAWMASHCHTVSLREKYVNRLSKFISVDVYGDCGELTCERNHTHWLSYPSCYDMLENQYKFYLSFENSMCKDYVTEKFFEILKRNIIPVVYGEANYSQIAPVHSYINALDYTPRKLAQYLKRLNTNEKLYNQYFWWKEHYRVEAGVEQMARHGFCDLCKKLHQEQNSNKYYHELVSEWHPNTQCRQLMT